MKFENHPESERIVSHFRSWAARHKNIKKIIVYGSRACGEQREDSDLDVAIEFEPLPGDDNIDATWAFEGKKWAEDLAPQIPWKLHLEMHDPAGSTPKVAGKLAKGHYVAFERGV